MLAPFNMPDPNHIPTAIVKQMLQQQRDDFAAMMTSLTNSFNERYDKLRETVTEIRVSLEYSQGEIATLKDSIHLQDKGLHETNTCIDGIKQNLMDLDNSIDYLENQSRRNNVVFDGVEENEKETWQESEEKVMTIIEDTMKLDGVKIERAHRVGKNRPRGRQIVVKFQNFKDRELVLRNGKRLKGSSIYVREDLSNKILSKRRDQLRACSKRPEIKGRSRTLTTTS